MSLRNEPIPRYRRVFPQVNPIFLDRDRDEGLASVKNSIKRLLYPEISEMIESVCVFYLENSERFVAFSEDGKCCLARRSDMLWSELHTFPDRPIKLELVSENTVLSADRGGRISLVNFLSGEVHFHSISGGVKCVEMKVSLCKKFAYVLYADGSLKRINLVSGEDSCLFESGKECLCMDIAPDNSFIAMAHSDCMDILDLSEGQIEKIIKCTEIRSIAISNNNLIYTARKDSLKVFNRNGIAEEIIHKDFTIYSYITLNRSNTFLACCCVDGSIHIWNLFNLNAEPVRSAKITHSVDRVGFTADDHIFYFSFHDHHLLIWDPSLLSIEKTVCFRDEKMKDLIFCDKMNYVIGLVYRLGITIWNSQTTEMLKNLSRFKFVAFTLAETQTELICLVDNEDAKELKLINLYNFEITEMGITENTNGMNLIRILNVKQDIIFAYENGILNIIKLNDRTIVKSDWVITREKISFICNFEEFIYVGTEEGTVLMINAATYTEEGDIIKHSNPIQTITVSYDRELIVSGDSQGHIAITSRKNRYTLNTIDIEMNRMKNLYISSDNKYLFVSATAKGVSLWDLVADKCLVSKKDYTSFVLSKDERSILLYNSGTWTIFPNPLQAQSDSIFGGPNSSACYQYIYSLIEGKCEEYDATMNECVISRNMYTTLHLYAYYRLTDFLKQAISNCSAFIQTMDGVSPLRYCMDYKIPQLNEILLHVIDIMKEESHYCCFFQEDLVNLHELGNEYISDVYGLLYRSLDNCDLPEYCPITTNLPIVKEVRDPSDLSKIEFFPNPPSSGTGIPLVFYIFRIPLCLALGSGKSIEFLSSLINCSNNDVFREEFIGYLLYYKWEKVRWFMRISMLIYFIYLLLLIFILVKIWRNSSVVLIIIVNSILVAYELFQCVSAPKPYFRKIINYFDIVRALLCYVFSGFWLVSGKSEIASALLVLLVVASFIRGIKYFEIFTGTRFMIFLLEEVFKDMLLFLVLLLYFTIAIASIFLAIDVDQENGLFDYFILSYTIGLGETSTSNDTSIERLVFIGGSLINTIIMLNLLISIMGDTFDRVQQEGTMADRKTLVKLLLEIEYLMPWNREITEKKYFIICKTDKSKYTNSWEGKLGLILATIDSNHKELLEQFKILNEHLLLGKKKPRRIRIINEEGLR